VIYILRAEPPELHLERRTNYSFKAEYFDERIACGAEGLVPIDLVNSAGHVVNHQHFNRLTPNELYMGRNAPLTSNFAFDIFIQQL
jgi:hypothetical protein